MKRKACKNYEKQMVLYIYGELSQPEWFDLENHLKECPGCAEQFEKFKKTREAVELNRRSIPSPDWSRSWTLIYNRLHRRSPAVPRRRLVLSPTGWAVLSSALAAVFVLGILVGKFWLFSPGKSMLPEFQPAAYLSSVLQRYVEDIRPILIEYANYTPDRTGSGHLLVKGRMIDDLLMQNRLLKKRLSDDKSRYLLELLEELEMILTEISNLTRSDPRSLSLIREIIEERQILFKMRMFQTKNIVNGTI